MKRIENKTYDLERSLYNLKDTIVDSCSFKGPKDGESVLKESRNVIIDNCDFSLRYPLWHANKYEIKNSIFDEPSRAPIWYAFNGSINNCKIYSVKAVRECDDIEINKSEIISPEFGWKSNHIRINDSRLESEYPFLDSKNININNLEFKGKYSFQYVENVVINNSNLKTKDAFWHSKNVTVINSVVDGEYLGWFSKGLTLINCKIIGTQPLCYCEDLKLIDCEMVNCDLSFEYSDVEASIKGYIISIKNPKSGNITVDKVGSIINSDSIMENKCNIYIKK